MYALVQQREQIVENKHNHIDSLKLKILLEEDKSRIRDLKSQVGILWGQIKRENKYIDALKSNIEDIQEQIEETDDTKSRKSQSEKSSLKRKSISKLDETMKRVVGISRLKF